jgi:hypothetical protein
MSHTGIDAPFAALVRHYQRTFPTDYAPTVLPDYDGALAYEAPYVIERLVRESVAASEDEARAMFRELKRFFVLSSIDESRVFEMGSFRIARVWDHFRRFPVSYAKYCREFFGIRISHAPDDAPIAGIDEFACFYQRVFKEPLPELWMDGNIH